MYSIGGPNGAVYFSINASGFVVAVIGHGADVNGSPVIITPSDPIGPIDQVDFGTLYQQLVAVRDQ